MSSDPSDCLRARPYIVEMSLAREFDDEDAVVAQQHLRICRRCQVELRELRELRDLCREAARVRILSPDQVEAGWQSLLSRIRSAGPFVSFREFSERVDRFGVAIHPQRLGERTDFRRTRPSSIDHSLRPTTSCDSGLPLICPSDHPRTRCTGFAMV